MTQESFRQKGGDSTPFKELKSSDLSYSLKELENSPNVIVRREALDRFIGRYGIEDPIEAAHYGEKLFQELKKFGINVIQTRLVVGNDESGIPMVFGITERILGEQLDEVADISEKTKKEFEALYTGLVRYLEYKQKDGGYYMKDIFRNRQYVYGKSKNDIESKIYLVDVDQEAHFVAPGSYDGIFLGCLNLVISTMKNTEKRFRVRFGSVRRETSQFLSSLPQDEKYTHLIEAMREKLKVS